MYLIVKVILEYKSEGKDFEVIDVLEIVGKGLKGIVNGKIVLVGNKVLMIVNNIGVLFEMEIIVELIVLVVIDD